MEEAELNRVRRDLHDREGTGEVERHREDVGRKDKGGVEEKKVDVDDGGRGDSLSPRDCRPMSDMLNIIWFVGFKC